MKLLRSLVSGLAGATALTICHQLLKANVPDAPRMDKLGRQALKKTITAAGGTLPSRTALKRYTFAGDILSNAAYYSLAAGSNSIWKGALLGTSAGVGAVTLPDKLGLDARHSNKTVRTRALTVGLYLLGGLVSGITHRALSAKK